MSAQHDPSPVVRTPQPEGIFWGNEEESGDFTRSKALSTEGAHGDYVGYGECARSPRRKNNAFPHKQRQHTVRAPAAWPRYFPTARQLLIHRAEEETRRSKRRC